MLNKPELYRHANSLQRLATQILLNGYSTKLNWRDDGQDSWLDVGCGSGDTTIDYILPILPKNFQRLVGADVSKKMIEYNRATHVYPKISFELINLGIDLTQQPLWQEETFDHISSFFCFMYIRDQQMAVNDLYKLLKPGGDILVAFPSSATVFAVYKKQATEKKWGDIYSDLETVVPCPCQDLLDPAKYFEDITKKSGFKDISVRVEDIKYTFNGYKALKNFLKSVNPFVDRLPAEKQEEYLDDLIIDYVNGKFTKDDFREDKKKLRHTEHYKFLVAYARK
ncbi:juvenile hormone acid O-methyltransferase-like [Bradysia coprophila]|uniref:juvenile hormone acid O-methyltransferase-like n=1 Tax=Bradysia coprophila TaxID=38358 RepID=UPI00187DB081|nr:juvenile hormone acid O-methyltransferase-like [Bradysia coprophila]